MKQKELLAQLQVRGVDINASAPVSYTHLDVYKRQPQNFGGEVFESVAVNEIVWVIRAEAQLFGGCTDNRCV